MKAAQTTQLNLQFNAPVQTHTRRIEKMFGDMLLSILIFLGIGGTLYSMFSIAAMPAVPLAVGIIIILLCNAFLLNKKYHIAAFVIIAVWIVILALLTFNDVRNGLMITANQISDVLGSHFGRIFPKYVITIAEADYAVCVTFFLIPVAAALSFLSVYLIKRTNIILSVFLLAAFTVLQIAIQIGPSLIWFLLFYLAETILLFKYHMARQTVDLAGLGKTTLTSLLVVAILSSALFGTVSAAFPPSAYEQPRYASTIEKSLSSFVDTIRYQKEKPSNMPEGNFTSLGHLELKEIPALSIVMREPDSLYLRGFVGSVYNGQGWEESDSAALYQSADLFYWLHEYDFYGQTQLARIALLLDAELQEGSYNDVTVHNMNASSQYIYAPYELISAPSDLLDENLIGDTALVSSGWSGQRTYAYQSLSNQVKRYSDLLSLLYENEYADDALIQTYLLNESHYNQFIYSAYVELPEYTGAILKSWLGGYELDEGESHLPYQQAKQNILDFLSTQVSYSETPPQTSGSSDFMRSFLEGGQGYSVHYATAATLMLRYYGIPARYVEGYIIPPSDLDGKLSNSEIRLNGTRAHAWTEYYQDGIGWIPFETTPPYLNVMEHSEDFLAYEPEQEGDPDSSDALDGDTAEMEEDHEYEPPPAKTEETADLFSMTAAALIALLLASALYFLIRTARKRRALSKRLASFKTGDHSIAIQNLFSYSLDLLRAMGFTTENESLFHALPSVGSLCGEVCAKQFAAVNHIYQEAVFSNHMMAQSQREEAVHLKDTIMARLVESSSLPKRLWLRVIRGLY